jgi:hypothetical protein
MICGQYEASPLFPCNSPGGHKWHPLYRPRNLIIVSDEEYEKMTAPVPQEVIEKRLEEVKEIRKKFTRVTPEEAIGILKGEDKKDVRSKKRRPLPGCSRHGPFGSCM